MKKETWLLLFTLLVLLAFLGSLFFLFGTNVLDYDAVLFQMEEGNRYVVANNLSDSCFPFRYYNRGCYYDPGKHYLVISDLQVYNLSKEETVGLCYQFAHKGAVAYCLNRNNESRRCADFAGTNTYLNRICNLGTGELIPSRQFGPYICSEVTDSCTFESEPIELVDYSDLG